MTETNKKDELLSLFTITLALFAVSVLIYMSRTPSITGSAALDDKGITISLFSFLILISIVTIIGAISTVNRVHKEKEQHRKAMIANKTMVFEHPNMDLVHYIMDARRSGHSDSEITKRLKEEGWKKEIIKKYL